MSERLSDDDLEYIEDAARRQDGYDSRGWPCVEVTGPAVLKLLRGAGAGGAGRSAAEVALHVTRARRHEEDGR